MNKRKVFAQELLVWHKSQHVIFPWRQTNDPFKILVSELLLRKTTRKQVSNLYERFFSIFPTFVALYRADTKSIEMVIRPLGMERVRAVALKEIAGAILTAHDGVVPCQREKLLALPHVGRYISNAVLCFAFGKDAPLLDTNVVRVTSRIFSLISKKKRAREDPEIWDAVQTMIPKGKGRDFNLAILDFASLICTAKNPKCCICPMFNICEHRKRSGPSRVLPQTKCESSKVYI